LPLDQQEQAFCLIPSHPLVSKKLAQAYTEEAMHQMLTQTTSKSLRTVMMQESSLVKGILRNQFTMLAGTIVTELINGDPNRTFGEFVGSVAKTQASFFAAQALVSGAIRAGSSLNGRGCRYYDSGRRVGPIGPSVRSYLR